ncbi:hypothetical protein LY16_01297 [Xenorhabdus doucetiae]|uniref:Transposase n=1 Tax=Xenorhabdus doucetiae TaxID=351671 RepID=A0ABY3NT01_9GAMM|nr:hypothetical protein LY16_01297 [Xenorhabdus doucetiae]
MWCFFAPRGVRGKEYSYHFGMPFKQKQRPKVLFQKSISVFFIFKLRPDQPQFKIYR